LTTNPGARCVSAAVADAAVGDLDRPSRENAAATSAPASIALDLTVASAYRNTSRLAVHAASYQRWNPASSCFFSWAPARRKTRLGVPHPISLATSHARAA